MKILVSCLLMAALLPSCVAYKSADTYFAAVGTNADEVDASPERLRIVKMDNAKAFKDATKMVENLWKAYLTLQGFQFVSGAYYNHQGKLVDSDTTVKLEQLRNARSEQEAAAALEKLKFVHQVTPPV